MNDFVKRSIDIIQCKQIKLFIVMSRLQQTTNFFIGVYYHDGGLIARERKMVMVQVTFSRSTIVVYRDLYGLVGLSSMECVLKSANNIIRV